MDDFFDKFLRKTLWIWLPFYALYRIVHDFATFVEERHAEMKKLRESQDR